MTENRSSISFDARNDTESRNEALNNFLHPDKGTLPDDKDIPLAGKGIRQLVDAQRPDSRFPTFHPQEGEPKTLDEVSYVVRLRYPETAAIVDERFTTTLQTLEEKPSDSDTKRIIALTGAYNYVRGMQVLRKIDPEQEVPHDEKGIPTGNVQRDTDIVPNFTLSPSALYQLQDRAQINPDDDVLYICAGGGGGVLFAAAGMPKTLDAVDLYTPDYYDLDGTFALAKDEIYAKLPVELKPKITTPKFIKADAANLPDFGSEEASKEGFQKDHYNKILLHPPYGRESMLAENLHELTEADGFMLWVRSVLSANKANKGPAELFSIIPPQWGRAIDAFREGKSMQETLTGLYDELRELRYYEGNNAEKLTKPHNEEHAEALNEQREKINAIFASGADQRDDLKEMGMFPLQINVLQLSGNVTR